MCNRSEIHIDPWNTQFRDIKQGSQAKSWAEKSPVAYWKGNPDVFSPIRTELLQCNDTDRWSAEILRQVDCLTFQIPPCTIAFSCIYPESFPFLNSIGLGRSSKRWFSAVQTV